MRSSKVNRRGQVDPGDNAVSLHESSFASKGAGSRSDAARVPPVIKKRSKKRRRRTNIVPGRELRNFPGRAIRKEIESTVPSGVALVKVSLNPAYKNEGLNLAVIRLQRLEKHSEKIEKWRKKLERKFSIGVHFQEETLRHDVRGQFRQYADTDHVLRDFSKLPSYPEFIHGIPRPVLTARDLAPLPDLPVKDLTSVPFIAIDNTSSRDPEDIIFHERLPNGNTRLRVGVVLFWRVKPGNKFAKYAEKAGESTYGRNISVPLFHEEYAHGEAAFLEGEPRYGMVNSIELDRRGRIVNHNTIIAKLMNHKQFNYDQVTRILSGREDHPLAQRLRSLARLTAIMEARPLPGTGFVGRGGMSGSQQMVGQCSIMSKHVFPLSFESFNQNADPSIPILHRAHRIPDPQVRQYFARQIREAGYQVTARMFDHSIQFRKALDWIRNNDKALYSELLNVSYQRGFYSTTNYGHEALGLTSYAPLKARKAGWINQIQLRARELGERGYSVAELEKLAESANEQRRANDYKAYKLRVLEDVKELEGELGKQCRARVTRVRTKNNSLYVEVPGTQRWGIVRLNGTGKKASDFRKANRLTVRLDGLDTRCLRGSYLFVKK